jgi:exosome complex exonuclease DIS3/RRP44
MDPSANIIDAKFYRSVIRSVASLTYDQAQAMLDTPDQEEAETEAQSSLSSRITQSVKFLNVLARQLKQQRIDEGALTLASPEVRFKFEDENSSNPTDVTEYAIKESHQLVEEFMLLANITGPPLLQARLIPHSVEEDVETLPHPGHPSSPSAAITRAIHSTGLRCQCCWCPPGHQVPLLPPSPPWLTLSSQHLQSSGCLS